MFYQVVDNLQTVPG